MPKKKSYRDRMGIDEKGENHTARIDMVSTPQQKKTYKIISDYIGCSRSKWVRLVLDEHIKSIDDPKLLKLLKGKIANDKT